MTTNTDSHQVLGQDPLIPPALLQAELPAVCFPSGGHFIQYLVDLVDSQKKQYRPSSEVDGNAPGLSLRRMIASWSWSVPAPSTILSPLLNTHIGYENFQLLFQTISASSCERISKSLGRQSAGKV